MRGCSHPALSQTQNTAQVTAQNRNDFFVHNHTSHFLSSMFHLRVFFPDSSITCYTHVTCCLHVGAHHTPTGRSLDPPCALEQQEPRGPLPACAPSPMLS